MCHKTNNHLLNYEETNATLNSRNVRTCRGRNYNGFFDMLPGVNLLLIGFEGIIIVISFYLLIRKLVLAYREKDKSAIRVSWLYIALATAIVAVIYTVPEWVVNH